MIKKLVGLVMVLVAVQGIWAGNDNNQQLRQNQTCRQRLINCLTGRNTVGLRHPHTSTVSGCAAGSMVVATGGCGPVVPTVLGTVFCMGGFFKLAQKACRAQDVRLYGDRDSRVTLEI